MVAVKPLWITFEGKQRQVKPRGIREPKDRVKGYRVEIRPPRSKSKIWVGTFKTRYKAQCAYDAAVYLTGKEPHYHLYPDNSLPRRPGSTYNIKKFVQKEAKKFAEKIDHVLVNPSSLEEHMVQDMDDQVQPAEESDDQEPLENMNYQDMDDQELVENMNYQDMDDQEPPVEDVNEHLGDLEVMPAAYLRGLKAADAGFVNDLLAYPPPESFTVFSSIQGDEYSSILDLFEGDPASRLIPSQEREPVHALFGDGNWSGFAVDEEGDYTLEEPWWTV